MKFKITKLPENLKTWPDGGILRVFMAISGIVILAASGILFSSCISNSSKTRPPKVLIHYMGWYGDTVFQNKSDSMRHWKYGHAHEPLIGLYNSTSNSTLTYHVLLSWACGIDGVIINVKDSYDESCMKALMKTINSIREIDSNDFKYEFAISYDDQGFDLSSPLDTAITKLTFLRDSILPAMNCYLSYKDHPLVFCFDYPNKFLSAAEFKNTIDTVFTKNKPLLIWNTIENNQDSVFYADAFYPWVQPGSSWDKINGLHWGKEYLDYYYQMVNHVNIRNQFPFTCGGVWPGFDDRKNTSWGDNRLIQRQEGAIYDSTWRYVLSYNKPLPLNYVVIETWNDWNEGTEIEPSIEDGYSYLKLTKQFISILKAEEREDDISGFQAALSIYQAASLVEGNPLSYSKYKPLLQNAIKAFLKKRFYDSSHIANKIITDCNFIKK